MISLYFVEISSFEVTKMVVYAAPLSNFIIGQTSMVLQRLNFGRIDLNKNNVIISDQQNQLLK